MAQFGRQPRRLELAALGAGFQSSSAGFFVLTADQEIWRILCQLKPGTSSTAARVLNQARMERSCWASGNHPIQVPRSHMWTRYFRSPTLCSRAPVRWSQPRSFVLRRLASSAGVNTSMERSANSSRGSCRYCRRWSIRFRRALSGQPAGGLGNREGRRACDALRLSRRCLIHLLNFEEQLPPNSKRCECSQQRYGKEVKHGDRIVSDS